MQIIEAVFKAGKFEPVGPVDLAENEHVRLKVETNDEWQNWLQGVQLHLAQIKTAQGVLPDSTLIIAEDRKRDG